MAKELENAIKEGVVEEVREANGTSYNCTVCPKQLKTKDTIKHHLKSNKHVKKLQEKKQKDGTETTDTNQDSPRGEKMPNRRTNANQRKGGKIEPKRNEVKEHEEVVPAIHEPNEEKEDNTDLVSNGLEENQDLQTENEVIANVLLAFFVLLWRILRFLVGFEDGSAIIAYTKNFLRGSTPDSQALKMAIDRSEIIIRSERDGRHYHCLPCQQHLRTKSALKSHLESEAHKKRVGLNKMEKDGISIENDPTPEGENLVEEAFQHNILFANDVCSDASPYWCTLCLKPLKVYGKLASHLSSIRHKKKVEICRSVSQTGKGSPEKQTGFTYYHDSSSKGRVYVFNVLKDRPGARADSLNIQKTFGGLGYDVFLHEDFTYGEMMRNIKKIQEDQTLASTGALILFILSHGSDMDTFISADSTGMSLNAIKQKFTAKGCPYLRSKPKIIFANFCRGKDIEEHCLYEDQVPAAEALVDMIIVHASNEGMIALRSKDTGTVFVKSLCEVLNEHGTRLFRHVFIDLSNKMKQKRGTTPVAIDHVFKDFKF
ncbi:uncharacterized protein LOC135205714 isoform X2 [Macrobrachium nipponense]